LVGGGLKTADQFRRPQKDLIPNGVDWIKANARSFDPDKNYLVLENGNKVFLKIKRVF
jgi:sulfide:quinone oxidoreductase